MITNSPCRSTKWPGSSRQPSLPNTYGSPTSSARAIAHSSPCAQPSANEAATRSEKPIAVPTARPIVERRNAGSSRPMITNRAMWAMRTNAYAHANSRARSPNASGTASATISSAAIAANIVERTSHSSGSTTLVSQA